MYLAHFGLTERPFSLTPDPRHLYMSERHREALAHLLYGVGESGGLVQLTGEVGTGKTTLCRCLLEQLPPDVDVALILNPRVTPVELLATICDEFKVAYPPEVTSLKTLVDALYRYLLEAHGRGRTTVLIVDEAQDLSADVLEQIRLLTNLETATHKLLQVILIGQPELAGILESRELRQVAQRVTARYHLTPLSGPETQGYIRHRLEVAGGRGTLFSPVATQEIHHLSGGIPRLINVICDRALLGAYAEDKRWVSIATVRRAAAEVRGRPARPRRRPVVAVAKVAVLATAVAAIAAGTVPVIDRAREAAPIPAAPVAAPALVSAPETLDELLSDPAVPSDRGSALAALYHRWSPEEPRPAGPLACRNRRLRELRCLVKTGAWKMVRRYDLPAMLELVTESGDKHYAVLTALGGTSATLQLGSGEFTMPLREIDQFWEGSFILLWNPPFDLIRPGARGAAVEWLRRRLAEIDGWAPRSETPDRYDNELKERVLAFQQSRSLLPDGLVGVETLLELTVALDVPGPFSLSSPDS